MATQSGLTEPLLADGDSDGGSESLHHVDSTQSVCEAVDIPPTPRRERTKGGPLTSVCPFILATEFCERLVRFATAQPGRPPPPRSDLALHLRHTTASPPTS
jgi:hypothetical protein